MATNGSSLKMIKEAARSFRDRSKVIVMQSQRARLARSKRVKEIPPLPSLSQRKRPFTYRVGTILDEFSELAWSQEFPVVPIPSPAWDEDLVQSLDMLLVEPAWDGNGGSWKGKLRGPQGEPSDELRRLLHGS